jgi:hypothetical protein
MELQPSRKGDSIFGPESPPVILNPIGFFYDKGTPRGAIYEALEEFQKFVNAKLKTDELKVGITYIRSDISASGCEKTVIRTGGTQPRAIANARRRTWFHSFGRMRRAACCAR